MGSCLEKTDTGLGRLGGVVGGLGFKGHRRKIPERAVAPRRIVEGLDIIEDDKFSVPASGWPRLVKPGFDFDRAPERFHGRVVAAVTGAAHTLYHAMVAKCSRVEVRRVLHTAV